MNVKDIFDNSKRIFDNGFISNVDDIDFSGRIDKATTFDSFKVEETYEMKLKRIRRELEELNTLRELPKNDKKNLTFKLQPTEDIDLSELACLLNLLKTVESKQNELEIKNLLSFEPNVKVKPKIMETFPNARDGVSNEEIKSLENRIHRLEKLIGVQGFDLDFGFLKNKDFQNIENIISDLERKFKMLLDINNNEYSEKVAVGNEKNIAKLLNKMETLNKEITFKNKKLSASLSFYLGNEEKTSETVESCQKNFIEKEDTKKLNTLFELVSEFNPDCLKNNNYNKKYVTVDVIKGLVKRLQSLNNLYLEYESVMNISKDSNNTLSILTKDLITWKETLEVANKNLLQMTNDIEKLNSIL